VSGQITALEEMIAQGADMQIVVRLLCLASIATGGIKAKSLDNIKREILQVSIQFGLDHRHTEFGIQGIWL